MTLFLWERRESRRGRYAVATCERGGGRVERLVQLQRPRRDFRRSRKSVCCVVGVEHGEIPDCSMGASRISLRSIRAADIDVGRRA